VAPVDAEEMRRFMPHTLDCPGPIYIRLAKGHDDVVSREEDGFEIGRAILLRPPGEVLFVTTGVMAQRALASADMLSAEGTACGVLHMHTVKPLDAEYLLDLASQVRLVVSVEEHTLIGGLGSALAELFVDHAWKAPLQRLERLGLPDHFFSDYGSQNFLLERCGLDPAGISQSVREALSS